MDELLFNLLISSDRDMVLGSNLSDRCTRFLPTNSIAPVIHKFNHSFPLYKKGSKRGALPARPVLTSFILISCLLSSFIFKKTFTGLFAQMSGAHQLA